MDLTDTAFKPYQWLDRAEIFNKNNDRIPTDWLEANADIIVLLFTANGIDKDGIILKFYEIYENVKYVNIPIEVIYVPLDESEEEMRTSYEKQANWFTFKFHDPLISVLKYMYNITCIPYLVVMKFDGTIVSRHGILDLEEYGKNAVITWLSETASTKKHRVFSKELAIYGEKWNYMNVDTQKSTKPEYQRKFSNILEEPKSTGQVNVIEKL